MTSRRAHSTSPQHGNDQAINRSIGGQYCRDGTQTPTRVVLYVSLLPPIQNPALHWLLHSLGGYSQLAKEPLSYCRVFSVLLLPPLPPPARAYLPPLNFYAVARFCCRREDPVRDYALAAVANACAHPVLAGHAKELGALERLRVLLETGATSVVPLFAVDLRRRSRVSRKQMVETAMARLDGAGLGGGGDVEEGGDGGTGRLKFYTFKWGVHPSVRMACTPKQRVRVVLGCIVWGVTVLLILRPVVV